MSFTTVIITIDNETGIDGRDIGKMIQRYTSQMKEPAVEVTATPTSVDVRFEKVYSEIAITGDLYARIAKVAKARNLTPEQILSAGAKKFGGIG